MIAYLDTCTILNLLQINYDDLYIKYLEKSFKEVRLAPIVFEELRANRFTNVINDSNKLALDEIIFKQIPKYIDNTKGSDFLDFTKKHNASCFKENGESHSVSYTLNTSRFEGNDLGDFLLKTHFITDDTPAQDDFNHFYHINVIGQILNSIDLMTVFFIKEYITKNDLIKYCHSLKYLYNKDVSILLTKLRSYSHNFSDDLTSKQKIILTNLIDVLSNLDSDTNDKIDNIKNNPDFEKLLIKNKDWKELLTKIEKSNFREKIPYINRRIKDFEKLWFI
ncbi:hypothetical protein NWE55_01785 [Myroides albus]|uniref:hypothetical protein n=1 Tax=Myroides albus TaxID=2562892 RepID=UPI0021596669|nr:hypothetical protein [Myroides albus]UVD80048.1 hypothetical protein NWE55_01785 [Myroides albus]